MSVVAIIPARFASTRFPGKPLVSETGRPLVQHVIEQVRQCPSIDRVMVATDHDGIAAAARAAGAEVAMTRSDHVSGTDRLAEVAGRLIGTGVELIVNVQGDEPEIEPQSLDLLVSLHRRASPAMATLACPFAADGPTRGPQSPHDPNCVKVVLAPADWWEARESPTAGLAVYFSRSLIPFPRDSGGEVTDPSRYLLHVGVYAYTPEFLLAYAGWPPSALEQVEKLEQLRVLERGKRIAVGLVPRAAVGIDTPQDYAAFVARFNASH